MCLWRFNARMYKIVVQASNKVEVKRHKPDLKTFDQIFSPVVVRGPTITGKDINLDRNRYVKEW